MSTLNSAEHILKRALRSSSIKMAVSFFVAFIILEAAVLLRAQVNSQEKFEQWIKSKKPQIEQALFLENHLSVNGIVDNFSAEMPSGINASLSVFNLSRESIQGNLSFPTQMIENGFHRSFLTNSFSYFDELKFGDKPQGYVLIQGTLGFEPLLLHATLTLISILGIFLIANSLLKTFSNVTSNRILSPLYIFRNHMTSTSKDNSITTLNITETNPTEEVLDLVAGYNTLVERVRNQQEDLSRLAGQKAVATMAKQVAHDIRSPLTALNMISMASKSLPEEERILLRSAVKRINDIANHLNTIEKARQQDVTPDLETAEPELIYGLVTSICSEKRTQYKLTKSLSLSEQYTNESRGAFVNLNAVEFKRVISNIIDNACDAARNESVEILIDVKCMNSSCVISIQDNGIGMSKAIINKLGTEGFTYGKATGSGLGLFHAQQAIRNINGKLEIESAVDQGTTVHIILPLTRDPIWFVNSIEITENTKIFVIDDDSSIHKTWQQVLNSLISPGQLHHFSSITECERFMSLHRIESSIFLVDHELQSSSETGTSFLSKLHADGKKYLVTSHWEDPSIRQALSKENIGLIPKLLVPFIIVRKIPTRSHLEPTV